MSFCSQTYQCRCCFSNSVRNPSLFFCFVRSQVHPILHKERSIILKKSAKSETLKSKGVRIKSIANAYQVEGVHRSMPSRACPILVSWTDDTVRETSRLPDQVSCLIQRLGADCPAIGHLNQDVRPFGGFGAFGLATPVVSYGPRGILIALG